MAREHGIQKQMRRTGRQVGSILRNAGMVADNNNPFPASAQGQGVVKGQRAHEGIQVMIAVGSFAGDAKKQVDLRRRFYVKRFHVR